MSRWAIAALAYGGAIYVAAAVVTFAIRHPELTDTQRFLRLWDALCWR